MQTTKYRLETFTDGVIAIIITIMVLSIPLPKKFEWLNLLEFFLSLFIYLLSFLVVGAFWSQHHQIFTYLDKVNSKIIASNIFFLFFLSLIPLFTKWVIENQGTLIPVIGYDIIYLLVSFFYALTFRLIITESNDQEIQQFREKIRSKQVDKPNFSWTPVIILLSIITAVLIISIYLPRLSVIILIGIPIVSSLFNLFTSERKKQKSYFSNQDDISNK